MSLKPKEETGAEVHHLDQATKLLSADMRL